MPNLLTIWPPHNRPAECDGCPRNASGRSSGFVPGYGSPTAALIVIGEQPGTNEVAEGRPFVGKSGQELSKGLGSIGRDGVYVTNVRKCLGAAGESDATRTTSIAHCTTTYLRREFEALETAGTVRSVLAIGADAMEVAIGVRSAIKWHGAVLTREECRAIREATLPH